MDFTNKTPLFSDFKPVDFQAWEAKALQDLKSADALKKLHWITTDGFTVPPLLTEADRDQFTFGPIIENQIVNTHPDYPAPRHWFNVPTIQVDNEKSANANALLALNNGADGLLFELNGSVNLDQLLKDILPQYIWLGFYTPEFDQQLQSDYSNYIRQQGILTDGFNGAFLVKNNRFTINMVEKTPIRNLHFGSDTFHNQGASPVQEIALILGQATDVFDDLTNQGHTIESLFSQSILSLPVGTSYFMEIAKLRAMRYLWSRLAHSFGFENYEAKDTQIHTSTSVWNQSRLDPHTNLLRFTTEAMSAILGGCQSLSVHPLDTTYSQSSAATQRWSRNISTILKEESYFDKVADPAAGSYYLEYLTQQLSERAWKLFQEIEEKGGQNKCFSTFIQPMLEQSKAEALKRIYTRKDIKVGVNHYANTLHHPTNDDTPRLAQAFEKLRERTEKFVLQNGEFNRPSVGLVPLSNSGMSKARQDFSENLFSLAGFQCQVQALNSPTTAAILVFCGSDEDYQSTAHTLIETSKNNHPSATLVLAGQPSNKEALQAIGIQYFIYANMDVVAFLNLIQDQILTQ